jgi:hypothetical protein
LIVGRRRFAVGEMAAPRIGASLVQSRVLLVGGDVEEQLDDQRAVIVLL